MSNARKNLTAAIATHKQHLEAMTALTAEAQSASDVARGVREEMAALEAQADEAARSSVVNGDALAVDDVEAKLSACKRRLAAATAIEGEKMQAVQQLQPIVGAAAEDMRWAARAVLEEEGATLLDRYERVHREDLELRWRIEKLCNHLMQNRGSSGENQGRPAFAAADRLVERLRNATYCDETEKWPVGRLQAEWAQFEDSLRGNPETPAPKGL